MNTFQCVLATNEFESFVFFLYNDVGIHWTTGDDSGGTNGLGGDKAIAGISVGDGDNYTVIPEFGSACVLDIDKTSNVGTPGVWMFKVGTSTYSELSYVYTYVSDQICKHVYTYVRSLHIRFFTFGDSQNLLGMTDTYVTGFEKSHLRRTIMNI